MTNFDVDLAYEDIYEVIPELKENIMNRTCLSNMSDYGYYDHMNMLQRNELMGSRSSLYESPVHSQNLISDWVKTSIMGDQTSFDYSPDFSSNARADTQTDIQSQLLVFKTQQIAQSRSFDDCSCSSYSSDVPQCTCDVQAKRLKTSFSMEQDALAMSLKQSQDAWLNELRESEFNRIQKEKLQSLLVPDPSSEYPYYANYLHDESSIYEPDTSQVLPLLNSIPETSPALFQRVPKSTETYNYNVPSPINSPGTKPPQKTTRPRLCHFLMELLSNPQQYSDIVEWVDQEKGVFKFLNSAEVASQWGRRRNKPHMKYENFARSLRTYIAKGILTKPRSKLVYRFTNQVC